MTGQELKQRRKKLELTQALLAQMLGVETNTVWRYETDRMEIPKTVNLAFMWIEFVLMNKEQFIGSKTVADALNGTQLHVNGSIKKKQ